MRLQRAFNNDRKIFGATRQYIAKPLDLNRPTMGFLNLILEILATTKPYLFLLPILYLTHWIAKARYFSPLSHIPGPWLASISKSWFIWHGLAGEQHKVHLHCHEKYGPIWRAMPNYVLINDPEWMQKIYKWDRTEWYSAFNVKDSYISTAATLSMEEHNAKRRRLGAAVNILN
jgi:hypothetical protein